MHSKKELKLKNKNKFTISTIKNKTTMANSNTSFTKLGNKLIIKNTI